MVDRIFKTLKLLSPVRFLSWILPDNEKFAKAESIAVANWVEFNKALIKEMYPPTADKTIPNWLEEFNLSDSSSYTDLDRVKIIAANYLLTGGQNPVYLRDRLQREFPDIDFDERTEFSLGDNPLYYRLVGELGSEEDAERLLTFIQKVFPLHLEFTDLTDVDDLITSAICNAARCGVALTGRNIGDP